MKKRTYSPTYVHILDLLFKLKTRKVDDTNQSQDSNTLNIIKLGTKSDRVIQEITIANDDLWNMCTSSEWYLLGRIGRELQYGNALWYCGLNKDTNKPLKNSSSIKQTIASLGRKDLLIPTETTDIYIVNPFYLRKGDLIRVLYGTAEELIECSKVTRDNIKSIRAPKGLDLSFDRSALGMY